MLGAREGLIPAIAPKCLIKKPHDSIRLIVYLIMKTMDIKINGVNSVVAYNVKNGFNCVYVDIYVKHRIAQQVHAKCLCADCIRYNRNHDYTIVELQIDTRGYDSLWYVIDDIKYYLDVNVVVNTDYYSSIKVAEELLRVL